MNLRRILSQAALIIGTLVFALGLQAYAQTYTAPTATPPTGNAQAPLDTGSAGNFKAGELVTNMSSNGQLGSALDGLVAGGNIVATGDICSQSSGICLNNLITGVTAGTGLTGGGTSGNVTVSANYGGSFEVISGGTTCVQKNPTTNSCSCSSGYNQSVKFYENSFGNIACYGTNELIKCVPQGFPYTPPPQTYSAC